MSDDFVDISNTSPETLNTNEKDEKRSNKDETSHKDDETTISHKDETTDNFLEKENVFNSSDEIKENENIISLLLNGLLKNLMKNSASQKEEDEEEENDEGEENDEDEDEENDEEEEDEEDDGDEDDGDEEDEEDYPEMFIIVENKKTFNYETSYADASRTMIARFHTFLEQNTSRYLRIDKNEEHITIYERHPNTFTPYEEHFIYHIEFFTVEKYKA